MNKSFIALIAAALMLASLIGCQSPRKVRIQENAAVFAALDPETQKIIQEGLFAPGFSTDLTYLALGKPNNVAKTETENGTVEVWKYRNFVYGNIGAMQL